MIEYNKDFLKAKRGSQLMVRLKAIKFQERLLCYLYFYIYWRFFALSLAGTNLLETQSL